MELFQSSQETLSLRDDAHSDLCMAGKDVSNCNVIYGDWKSIFLRAWKSRLVVAKQRLNLMLIMSGRRYQGSRC